MKFQPLHEYRILMIMSYFISSCASAAMINNLNNKEKYIKHLQANNTFKTQQENMSRVMEGCAYRD